MARDNFTKAVIDKLRTRVAHRCSNPDCRVPTVGPALISDKTTTIGVAAHITAASVGGPRYDLSLTEKARKSLSNGIWLCSNCSVVIDRDVERYSVKLLNQWKFDAEQLARQELGKKLPHKDDAIDTLTTALTGQAKKLIPEAIANIHKATSNTLESLDTRFIVKSSHVNGKTKFELIPKQIVPLSLNIKEDYADEYLSKFKQLMEHGIDLSIDGQAVSIVGSKLLEEISSSLPTGSVQLIANKKKATQKLWLINKQTSIIERFDDIVGEISFGSKSFSFLGTACNGIFKFNYQLTHLPKAPSSTVFVSLDFAQWTNQDVSCLPYFEKFLSFYEKAAEGWELASSLEIDGNELLKSTEISIGKNTEVLGIYQTLCTIEKVRTLASILNLKIAFIPECAFSQGEYHALLEAVSVAQKNAKYSQKEFTARISAKYLVDKDAKSIKLLQQTDGPINIDIVEEGAQGLSIYGQQIVLPKRIFRFSSLLPNLSSIINIVQYSEGDSIDLELIPTDQFELRVEFINDQAEIKDQS